MHIHRHRPVPRLTTNEASDMSHEPILKLRGFSTAQLIEELARRSNEHRTSQPRDWCENCTHFIAWAEGKTPDAPMPDDYNPCAMRHTMRFQVPESVGDTDYGYYRSVCADRQPRENEA